MTMPLQQRRADHCLLEMLEMMSQSSFAVYELKNFNILSPQLNNLSRVL